MTTQKVSNDPPQRLCVLGLGYIGLPTAAMFATHRLEVVGIDIDQEVVEILNNGDVHIKESGLKTVVQAVIRSGNLCVDSSPAHADTQPANLHT